jgi:hypothetical protein
VSSDTGWSVSMSVAHDDGTTTTVTWILNRERYRQIRQAYERGLGPPGAQAVCVDDGEPIIYSKDLYINDQVRALRSSHLLELAGRQ